jgi:hypothetical protein
MKQDKVILENSKAIEPVNNGEITYNSTLNKFRKRENGVVSDLDTGGGGGGLSFQEILRQKTILNNL